MIALLSSNWDEISKLKKDIETRSESESSELDCFAGKLCGQSVILAVSGVGIKRARNATSIIIQKYKPSLIVFAGFGGALSSDLKLGDIVLGESVTSLKKNEDRALFHNFSVDNENIKRGKLLTESRFINEAEEKKHLFNLSGALVVDMETWGVVEAALQSDTPVASIRAISDEADEQLPDMAAIYSNNGELNSKKAESYFEANPELLAPYFKFRFTNTPRAQESLCSFLGKLVSSL